MGDLTSRLLQEAWDLLLTDRYTLAQICEELTSNGYTRSTGRPSASTDPKTGERKTAENRLQILIHNAFYTGWVVSERFGIKLGEVRGDWEPIITKEEYLRGVEILHSHYIEKSRVRRSFYLLRGLLWIRIKGALTKCSAPPQKVAPCAIHELRLVHHLNTCPVA